MAFNGTEGASIPLETASGWTSNYRTANPGETLAHFFGREIIERILAQPGCEGIRMYYALDEHGKKQLLLVGSAADENDQVDGTIADLSIPCPDACGNSNPLNS
ncbi:MAG: hypothetical protein ACFB10_03860 [Salibacteraceae bacterium]